MPAIATPQGRALLKGVGVPTHLIGTNCRMANSQTTSLFYFNSRSPHYVREAVTALKIVLPNWFVETNGPGQATYTAAIEYNGTFTQVLFSGSPSAVVAAGTEIVSDWTNVAIPKDAKFFVRVFANAPSGFVYHALNSSTIYGTQGQALQYSATSLTDLTMGGAIGTSNTQAGFWPLAILGRTSRPAVAIIGDSIGFGAFNGDSNDGTHVALGYLERALEPYYPTLNLCLTGDSGLNFLGNHSKRAAAANAYCSHVVDEYGFNDHAQTLATLQAMVQQLAALFAGKKVLRTTITSNTTSTGSWAAADRSDQTVTSDFVVSGKIDQLNAWIAAGGIAGVAGYIDLRAGAFAADNKWIADGNANKFTSDGTHPKQPATLAMAALFNPALIT